MLTLLREANALPAAAPLVDDDRRDVYIAAKRELLDEIVPGEQSQ